MPQQRFNLLPHRQMASRRALRLLGRQMLLVSALAVVLAAMGAVYQHGRLAQVVAMNEVLNAAISDALPEYRQAARLRERYTKLLQRQQLIERLDARRSTSVLLLADVAEALPQQVYLTRLEENGELFTVEGRAVDTGAIARFMEKLSGSAYLTGTSLKEIRTQNAEKDAVAPFQFLIVGRVILNQGGRAAGSEGASR